MQNNSFKCTSKLQWHEGMLLSPQHFQYSDERNATVAFIQSQFQAYCSWGIFNFQFDESLINQGLISISELNAIFPDGTVVELLCNKDSGNVLELDLKKLALDSATSFDIFVCIPTVANNRYDSKVCIGIQDENSADNVINIPILQPKIFLNPFKCAENSTGFALFKIDFDGKQFFNKPHIPPCCNITNQTTVMKRLGAVILSMRQKAQHLVNKNKYTSSATISRDAQDILRPVISCICMLEPLVGLTKLHPEKLFENLVRVTSLLLPLNTDSVPSVLVTYDPFNPYDAISFYLNLIEKSISTIQQKYTSIPFHQEDRLFYLHMQPDFFKDQLLIGFRAGSGMTDYQLQQWVEDAIIACDDKIDLVTTKRITGAARLSLLEQEAVDLIPHSGTILYKFNNHDEFIKIKQNLNIFNAGDSHSKRPLDITLYVRQSD